ncbi:MAG: hypothetical protein PWP46_2045 [Fusobacteriaceae bacterium]|jgi:hypothetical protein|nr:hypothetical protein [Fusobacteriales bacterium]MDN5305159.1 hypothetical protein [Fusobacteriaceae bacterium]
MKKVVSVMLLLLVLMFQVSFADNNKTGFTINVEIPIWDSVF